MDNRANIQNGVVLLADDDDAFRESHAALLRRHGYTCWCAADAAASKKILQEMEVDLLIADIMMPGNATLELVEGMPLIAPGLPVILLTGQPAIETAVRSVRLAVAAYLTKPPDLDELLALVSESIKNYRRLRGVRESRKHLEVWAGELASIEAALDVHPGMMPADTTQNYLRVTLRNLMLQLADLDRAVAAWSRFDPALADLRQLDLIAAIRRSVEVLEKSRQNFKSKELGELRRQLQALIPLDSPGNDSQPPSLGS